MSDLGSEKNFKSACSNAGASIFAIFAVIAVIVIGTHFNLLKNDPFLYRDDYLGVAPLAEVQSLKDYLVARENFKIFDLLPVRDFSFYLDYRVKALTGFSPFHFTNLLVWLCVLAISFKTVGLLHGRSRIVQGAFLLYATHPIFMGSTAWISARKHLLAAFFILCATYLLLKAIRDGTRKPFLLGIGVCSLYLLSVFSQPITALWPVWALLYVALSEASGDRKKLCYAVAGVCIPIMVLVLFANFQFYTGGYSKVASVPKFESHPDANMGMRLLALGRYFMNFVMPTRLAVAYYPGSTFNFIGLILFGAFAAICFRLLPLKQVLIWGAFFFFPLLIVTVRLTNIFVSDTYVVTAAFGLLNLFILIATKASAHVFQRPMARRLSLAAALAVLVGYVALSARYAATWENDSALWEHAYRTEPSPSTLKAHTEWLLHRRAFGEALRVSTWLKEWMSNEPLAEGLWARALFENPAIPAEKKIADIEKQSASSPWRDYYLSILYAQKREFVKAFNLVANHFFTSEEYKESPETVGAFAYSYCVRAETKQCDRYLESLKKHYGSSWDSDLFKAHLKKLGL